jgi:3-hydroxymyristoyl/3-hydroxydecanoyl-(acyl carrier protein) dehydratase
VLDTGFVADCPYAPEAILIDEILEVDRDASRIVARMPTREDLPFTVHQRVHPVRHPLHVAAAVMVHLTGMLGFAHAYFVLDLRQDDGWVGFGTNIQEARFGRLVAVGPPLRAECRATQVRRIRDNLYVKYAFLFEQEDAVVYESRQAAVWRRVLAEHGERPGRSDP